MVCIDYEDWDKAIRLDTPKIYPQLETKGPQLADIYKSFENYIKSYRENQAKNKATLDKNKKLQKYTFIK